MTGFPWLCRLTFLLIFNGCRPIAVSAQSPSGPVASDSPSTSTSQTLDEFSRAAIGDPEVLEVTPGVFVAVGYDLANVTVVTTDAGLVVIDTGACSRPATEMRLALGQHVALDLSALIYTHGDIEQTGGAGVWLGDQRCPIYASARMPAEFWRAAVVLQRSQLRRGLRQFGVFLPSDRRVPSALGVAPTVGDLTALPEIRMPDQLVTDHGQFESGGVRFELIAAPGPSPDHLFVWIPEKRTLVVGDLFMHGFPEVASVRGAREVSLSQWIRALDHMRRLPVEHLVASRHRPLAGRAEIARALTDYRDALQWLRDDALRAINRGEPVAEFASRFRLPKALADSPYLNEATCARQSAARATYLREAGWFDESVEALVSLEPVEASWREIELMGGVEAVVHAAAEAQSQGNDAWAVHLWSKLRQSGDHLDLQARDACEKALAAAIGTVSRTIPDAATNNYLRSLADELETGSPALPAWPCPSDETLREIPLEAFFASMGVRLRPDAAKNVDLTVRLTLTDENEDYLATIRHGIFEVLPYRDAPVDAAAPVAWVLTEGLTWRKVCMGVVNSTVETLAGRIEARGNVAALRRFVRCFDVPKEYEKAPRTRVASDRVAASGGR